MKHALKKLAVTTCLLAAIGGSAAAADLQPNSLLAIDRNRSAVIDQIVTHFKGNFADGQEQMVRETLQSLRADHLLAASLAPNLNGLLAAITSADTGIGGALIHSKEGSKDVVLKNLGDAQADLVYTPVTPCRLFDTRGSQGGLGTPLLGTRRTYGAITPVTNQGGPGGCSAGTGATVALIQIGTLTPGGSGLLQGGAQGASLPNALILYQVGDQYGTAVAMPLNPANGRFDLQEQFAQADLYGDLLGYFRAPPNFPMAAVINADGSLARGSSHVVSAQSTGGTGFYEVIFDRDVTGCTYTATLGFANGGNPISGSVGVTNRNFNANGIFLSTYDATGTAANRGFHVTVTC